MTTQPLPDALIEASFLRGQAVWHGDGPSCLALEDGAACFAMDPDEARLIAGGARLSVWSIEARSVLLTLNNPLFSRSVHARPRVSWVRGGAAVLLDDGAKLGVCEVAEGAKMAAVPFASPARYAMSGDGWVMARSTALGSFEVVDTEGWEARWETPVPLTHLHDVALDGAGARLATLARGRLEVWQVGEGAPLLEAEVSLGAQRVTLSRDGERVACAGPERLEVWDVARGALLWQRPLGAPLGPAVFTREGGQVWAVVEGDGGSSGGARVVCLSAADGAQVRARPFRVVRAGEAPEAPAPAQLFPQADLLFDGIDTSRTGALLTLQRLSTGEAYPSAHDQRARSGDAEAALAWVGDDEALRVQRDGAIARLSGGLVVEEVGPVLAPLAPRAYQRVTLRISPDRARFALALHDARVLMVGDVRTLEAEVVPCDVVGYGTNAQAHDVAWCADSRRLVAINHARGSYGARDETYFRAVDLDQPGAFQALAHIPYSAPALMDCTVAHPEGGLVAVSGSQALIMREGEAPRTLRFDAVAQKAVAASGASMRALLKSGAVVCLKTGTFVAQLEGCDWLDDGVMLAQGALLAQLGGLRGAPRLRVWATDDGRLLGDLALPDVQLTLAADRLVAHAAGRATVVRLEGLERLLERQGSDHADARVHRSLEALRELAHREAADVFGRRRRWEALVDLLSRWPGPVDVAVEYLRAHGVSGPMPDAWIGVLCEGRDVPAAAAASALERRAPHLIGARPDSAWVRLLRSPHLTGLETLTLSAGPEALEALARADLPRLEALDLTAAGFTAAHGALLRDSAWLRGLRALSLGFRAQSADLQAADAAAADGLRALAQAPLSRLDTLEMAGLSAPSTAAFFEAAASLDGLHTLGLANTHHDYAFLADHPNLASLRALRVVLRLEESAQAGATLAFLRAPHLAHLERLTLDAGQLSPALAEALCDAPCAGALRALEVRLDARSAETLGALRLPRLEALTVHDGALETADVRALTDNPHLGTLKTLQATISKRVHTKRLNALRMRHPGLALKAP